MKNTNKIPKKIPKPQAILQAWIPFKQIIGVTSIHTKNDYNQACKIVNVLLDAIGTNENHPLSDVLDYLSNQIKIYEDENFVIPASSPKEVLFFLMDQHRLKQEDLSDCAPQSRISDILNGKRSISKEIAKRLAKRFHVRADIFL